MPPHITYFRMRAKPGSRDKVIHHFNQWLRERRPDTPGYVRVVLCSRVDDPDEFMAYAMFADKETYDRNSSSAVQHEWYEQLRSHLLEDPEWFDSTLEVQRMG